MPEEHTIKLETGGDDNAIDTAHELGEHEGRLKAVEGRLDAKPWLHDVSQLGTELRGEMQTALSAISQAPSQVQSQLETVVDKVQELGEKLEAEVGTDHLPEASNPEPAAPLDPEAEPEEAEISDNPLRRMGRFFLG